jgi:hypothetical protein
MLRSQLSAVLSLSVLRSPPVAAQIVDVSAERSRPCWTNVTHRIDTCWLSRFEGPLLGTMRLWGLVKQMFPKQGRLHSAQEQSRPYTEGRTRGRAYDIMR